MQIAQTDGIESRHTAQAWHFLRQAGYQVPADRARTVLGAVAEMPVAKGHDVLAAYEDGTARYLNYSGAALLWEGRSDTQVQRAITGWLTAAKAIASAVGTWDEPTLPPVPAGHARLRHRLDAVRITQAHVCRRVVSARSLTETVAYI